MERLFSQSLFILLLATLTACSGGQRRTYINRDFTWDEAQDIIEERSFSNVIKNADNQQPVGLGLVMSISDSWTKAGMYRVGQCTGFLLDSTTMLTNAHCVSKRVRDKDPNISCGRRVYFAHPSSNENYECDRVLFAHASYDDPDYDDDIDESAIEPDVVVIKIRSVGRMAFYELAGRPMKQGEELVVHSMNPQQSDGLRGHFTIDTRLQVRDSVADGFAFRVLDFLGGNRPRHGNSGSPISTKGADEKVVGILFGVHNNRNISVDLNCLQKPGFMGEWTWKPGCASRTAVAF